MQKKNNKERGHLVSSPRRNVSLIKLEINSPNGENFLIKRESSKALSKERKKLARVQDFALQYLCSQERALLRCKKEGY